jgi:RimJ/RimL family protein N-acetyltransferase
VDAVGARRAAGARAEDRARRVLSSFDAVENFTYGIFAADEAEVLGGTGLHPRVGLGGLEIGYWVRASATRQGS